MVIKMSFVTSWRYIPVMNVSVCDMQNTILLLTDKNLNVIRNEKISFLAYLQAKI